MSGEGGGGLFSRAGTHHDIMCVRDERTREILKDGVGRTQNIPASSYAALSVLRRFFDFFGIGTETADSSEETKGYVVLDAE